MGGAAVVVLTAGIRAAAGVLNPILMAGFIALLLQPLVRRLDKLGVADGGAAASAVGEGSIAVSFVHQVLQE